MMVQLIGMEIQQLDQAQEDGHQLYYCWVGIDQIKMITCSINLHNLVYYNGIGEFWKPTYENFTFSLMHKFLRTNHAVNQGLSQLAFFGLAVNLVLFLRRVLDQGNAEAANNVSKWTGTVYLCSLIGAFLSDSYWGRYMACTIFQLILLLVINIYFFRTNDLSY